MTNSVAYAALKLQTAPDGTIWAASGDNSPMSMHRQLYDFVASLGGVRLTTVGIIGAPCNAALIVAIYDYTVEYGGRLEVVSPRICDTPQELQSPEIAIYRSRQCLWAPSQGGWHRADSNDRAMYYLVACVQRDGAASASVQQALRGHPAWHDLAFIQGANPLACAQILHDIVDPRWFVNPEKPDRMSRLRFYMGLMPDVQKRVSAGKITTPREHRCATVQAAWAAGGTVDKLSSGYFLRRLCELAGNGWSGQLRGSQKFLTYLKHTWLQALYADTRYSGSNALFMPENVFGSRDDVRAYYAHRGADLSA